MLKRIFLLIVPFFSYSQQNIVKDSTTINHILKNCNEQSIKQASELLIKYREEQKDNMFDYTLKTYYEILQSAQCSKYDTLLADLWTQNKVISPLFFENYFLKSNQSYSSLIIGFKKKQDFRFANNKTQELTLSQGINNSLLFKMLKFVKEKSSIDYNEVVKNNIAHLDGHNLLNFIYVIKDNFDLTLFNSDLIQKSENVKYPFDLDFLIKELITDEIYHSKIQEILNEKKDIWDRGNWSLKFWNFIKLYNFHIKSEPFYYIDERGEKKYNVEKFVSHHTKNGNIGEFPLIHVNYEMKFNYSKEYTSLIEYLKTLNLQAIEVTSSIDAVKLYGKRGEDGFLKIITK